MTSISIPVVGLASNDPIPGDYQQINFSQSPAPSGSGSYRTLILANKLSTGTATADTVIYGPNTSVPLTNQDDANALGGFGSEAARMYAQYTAANPYASVWMVFITESVGAKATGTLTFTTTAVTSGTARVFIGHEFVDVSITAGDTPTTIAANVVLAINGKPSLPVTSTSALGVVTLTAKQKGLRGNWIRFNCIVYGANIATTVSPASPTNMSGGTTADVWTTALSTIRPERFYYIISADDGGQSSPNLAALASQVNLQAEPLNDIRQIVIAGSNDSLANTITIATAINSARCRLLWQYQGDMLPSELACALAGAISLKELSFGVNSCNLNFYGSTDESKLYWNVPVPRTGNGIVRTQMAAALNNGICPVVKVSSNQTALLSCITTKSLSNSLPDYGIRPAHKVSIMDRFVDDVQVVMRKQLAGKLIGNDPKPGQKPIAGVATPRDLLAILQKKVSEYEESGLLQDADATKKGIIALREVADPQRFSSKTQLKPADTLDRTANVSDQLSF